MKQTFHLRQRVFLDLFRQIAVFQPQLAGNDHRHHIASSGEVSGDDFTFGVDDGGIGGACAEVEDRQRTRGAGGGQRAENGGFGLCAADLYVDIELLLDLAGNHRHLQTVRFHHGGDAHGLLQRELPGQTAGDAHRNRGVNGQQILNENLAAGLVGQLGHGLAHVFQHAADIGPRLAGDVIEFATAVDRFHDGFGAGGDIHAHGSALSQQLQVTGGYRPRFDVAGWRFDHHGGTVANQRASHRHDVFRLIGVEVKYGGDAVGVRERFNDLPRDGDLNCRQHPQRNAVDVQHFVNDRQRFFQPVADQHAIVTLQNDAGNLISGAQGSVNHAGDIGKVKRRRHHQDIGRVRRAG